MPSSTRPPREFHVAVCDSPSFNDAKVVFETLDRLHAVRPITRLILGDAIGVGRLAQAWGKEESGLVLMTFESNLRKHGAAAAGLRDSAMLTKGDPHLVLVFPDSSETARLVSIAKERSIPVILVGIDGSLDVAKTRQLWVHALAKILREKKGAP